MAYSGPVSLRSDQNLYAGEWSRVYAITDPNGVPAEWYLGIVKGGLLETTRETLTFLGTTFPAKVEYTAPITVNMRFTGTAHELTVGLLHLVVGDEEIDSANQYINPGAACAFADVDVALRGERDNCYRHMLAFQLHHARSSGAAQINTAPNDVIGMPLEFDALNDENGTFGEGTADSPLGWIWSSYLANMAD